MAWLPALRFLLSLAHAFFLSARRGRVVRRFRGIVSSFALLRVRAADMAIYSVEGKLGTGKTKFCVWRAQGALRDGLRVASNIDLELDQLVPELPKAHYTRIPDKPTAPDLEDIGHGNPDSYDEEKNGLLILDELGSWLNSRSFQDKTRMPVIDWLIHARKKGWHVFFIVQDASMIDAQVRNALIEYSCRCRRLDKVKIPFFGDILGMFHKRLAYMPRIHMVAARIGEGPQEIVAERWNFKGDDLHSAYDTRQVFTAQGDYRTREVLSPLYFDTPTVKPSIFSRLLAFFFKPLNVSKLRKDPHPLVAKVMQLPPDERIKHIKRLTSLGAI